MIEDKREVLTRYALLASDSLDRITLLDTFTKKGRMTQAHNKRKAAGESHLIKAKVTIQIEEIY